MAGPRRNPQPHSEEKLAAITVGPLVPLDRKIALEPPDPRWPQQYDVEAIKVCAALGEVALAVHHVGSTSVPGLSAKPVIDMVLVVKVSEDEAAYVRALAAVGYVLRIREPDWFEHRLLKKIEPAVNLHVFSAGCVEVSRMVAFRDWLRTHEPDRLLYEQTKHVLAVQEWRYMQHYADAKTTVVKEILARATASQGQEETVAVDDDRTEKLRRATMTLYRAFHDYPLRKKIESCPHCKLESTEESLKAKSLQHLTWADFGVFPSKAMTTFGDEFDFKHFLPRILELHVLDSENSPHDVSFSFAKLQYANWTLWPDFEVAAVRGFIHAWFRELQAREQHTGDESIDLEELRSALAEAPWFLPAG